MNNESEQAMNDVVFEEMYEGMCEEMCEEMCKKMDKEGCSAVGYQDVDVCIPVTIRPFGEAGNAKTQCLGRPVVSAGCDICQGKTGGVCNFTISQRLRVEVPVIFGARAEVGDVTVECGCAEVVS